jgi:adenylosuccinate lyase
VGDVPVSDAKEIMRMASTDYVKLDRVKEIESEIRHDLMAVVRALSEVCGSSGGYIHLGATSSDILDTATALQLKEAISIIIDRLHNLSEILANYANREKKTIIIGRTHGQHAIPTTVGFKFAIWLMEVSRHIERLQECSKRVLVGKMSGAVGTQAGFGENALEVQRLVMEKLDLGTTEISTQIVQRDRHAEFLCILGMIASSLDKFSTEVRQLQRPEIGELAEPFRRSSQVGSSTMPQKRNPTRSERIGGLAKVVRSLVQPSLENIVTWHERDLTNSSCERFIIPEACILVDYMIETMTGIFEGLEMDRERMKQNIILTQGRVMSESVMIQLVKRGVGRQEAHELIRNIALISESENQHFLEALLENETVISKMTRKEVEEALKPENYLGTAIKQIENILASLK